MQRLVDLHIHTNHSDGIHPPARVVELAAEQGLAAIAIADHDTVSGIDEAMAAGAALGVEIITSVELSVEYGKFHDVHLLGYLMDHRDPGLNQLLADYRERRDARGKAIVEKINARLKTHRLPPISYEEVAALAKGSLGRPHIARVLIGKGAARDMEDAFRRYLVPCNVPKKYFPVREAIETVHGLGGVAVLAHPTSITTDRGLLKTVVSDLAAMGLDGLEVFNNMCFSDDMIFLEGLARTHDLTMTGGSDFHGTEDDVEIGVGRGGLAVSYRWVERLREIRARRGNST